MNLILGNSSSDPLNAGFIKTNDNNIQTNELMTSISSMKYTLSIK